MSVRETECKPKTMAHFPDNDGYRWLELGDETNPYGYAAIRERGNALELHLTLARWGPGVRRHIKADSQWLQREAKRLGKSKIMAIRADSSGRFDNKLFRFARLFGFTDCCVLQTASIEVD